MPKMEKEILSRKNKYGKDDPTTFEAIGKIEIGPDFTVRLGGAVLGTTKLSPQAVIDELEAAGIKTNPWLLSDRARKGVIPRPSMMGCGRGRGKITLHSGEAPAEYYASEKLKKVLNITFSEIKQIRDIALQVDKRKFFLTIFQKPENFIAYVWLYYKIEFLGLSEKMPVLVLWKMHDKGGIGQTKRERSISFEIMSYADRPLPDGYDFMEVLNVNEIKEEDNPEEFKKWWRTLKKIEKNNIP